VGVAGGRKTLRRRRDRRGDMSAVLSRAANFLPGITCTTLQALRLPRCLPLLSLDAISATRLSAVLLRVCAGGATAASLCREPPQAGRGMSGLIRGVRRGQPWQGTRMPVRDDAELRWATWRLARISRTPRALRLPARGVTLVCTARLRAGLIVRARFAGNVPTSLCVNLSAGYLCATWFACSGAGMHTPRRGDAQQRRRRWACMPRQRTHRLFLRTYPSP